MGYNPPSWRRPHHTTHNHKGSQQTRLHHSPVANGRNQHRRQPTGEHHRTVVSDQPQPASPLTKPFDIEELETAMGKLKP
ncbi:putative phospholipid-transporting ATPase IH [Dissostichus eleginoides]|uniref:Phospholipid-transporting ATPase IH n=1 Tax=Dissostichus eleginoides TaxID=100907 RepID=A0AAD9C4F8_DISEL|nr:putative phospholipid-transporting ATPase IH [Dissostichus eleginoides]